MPQLGLFYLGITAALLVLATLGVLVAPKGERVEAATWLSLGAVLWPFMLLAMAFDAIVDGGARLARRLKIR